MFKVYYSVKMPFFSYDLSNKLPMFGNRTKFKVISHAIYKIKSLDSHI